MSTEIPIWVNGKIRWLSGMDKKTTCKDIVEVLLEGEGVSKSEAKDYTIMERWRKVERPVDENSKILKIWSHWGNEKKEVRLCLRRVDNEVDSGRGSPVGSGYLPSLRRKRNRIRGRGKHPWAYEETLHPRRLAELGRFDRKQYDECPHIKTKQNELINDYGTLQDTNACDNKIYYDKLCDADNLNRRISGHKSYHCSGTGKLHSTPVCNSTENHSKKPKCCSKRESKQRVRNSENIEKLMKLILAQGATIQSQLQKLKEREEQIELLEHERHRERIERNGRNYLLETYLGSLKDAEIPDETNDPENFTQTAGEDKTIEAETSLYRGDQVHSGHGKEQNSFSSKSQHKSTRSKSESRTQGCKTEGTLKRTFSDNALVETSETLNCSGKEVIQNLVIENTKEEFQEVVELKKIQSQIEMWEKVFKINKKLEKEEENLVRLHIKIKKIQSENYRIVKEKMTNDKKEKDAEADSPDLEQNPRVDDSETRDCAELEKNLETLRSDLDHNSKEIYKNFTRLIKEDETVEQKRSCLSKIMTDLERTNHEHDMLNEMLAFRESENRQTDQRAVSFYESGSEAATKNEMFGGNAESFPQNSRDNFSQRTTEEEGKQKEITDEVLLPMKSKIVKISFEDKIQNYGSSESSQGILPYKAPAPVPPGALKSILKNRKNSFTKICNLNNEYQKYQGLSQNYEHSQVLQKNLSMNDCYIDTYYPHPPDVPDRLNSSYPYTIPYPIYINYPNNQNSITQLSKLSENLKSSCLLKNPQTQETTKAPFSHGTMTTTKAVPHNDTDSSTSSDTSGLSSMYSSSTTVEEPYAEKSYVLDTLV